MSASVGVIGAGAAGVASAWSLRRAGFEVTVFSHRAGATSLGSGAIDAWPPGSPGAAEHGTLTSDALEFAQALGVWTFRPGRVATRQGLTRATIGRDSALLDLEPLAGHKVAVADIERDEWDAPGIARALSASPWAKSTRTVFEAVKVSALRRGAERRISAYDFAALHDHPERAAWLGELLEQASAGYGAWLLGPWLGLGPGVPDQVRERVGLPVGEVTSPLGGPAGARFDAASRRLLEAVSVKRRDARVLRVSRRENRWSVEIEDDAGERQIWAFDAVVLAVGGVAAGGIALDADPERGRNGFRLSLAAPVRLSLDGEVSGQFSSLFGPNFETTGFGPLERVGVEVSSQGWVLSDAGPEIGLAAAGDCVSARPRTVFEAVRSGCAAARTVTLYLAAH